MLKIKLNAASQGGQDGSNSLHEKKRRKTEREVKEREQRSTTQTGWAAYQPQPLSLSFLLSSSAGLNLIGIYKISHSPSSLFSFVLPLQTHFVQKALYAASHSLLLYPVQRSNPYPPLKNVLA